MSIINSIKDAGMDIFISHHPKVLQFKREAKHLRKTHRDKSLMQCQEIIARQHSFHSWHSFNQAIKKHYAKGIENIPYIITPALEKQSDAYLVGYDINFGHYKWQDERSMRTHNCIVGEDVYKSFDIFLAIQAIEKGHEVFFINGANDNETIDLLKHKAVEYGRKDNIKIINNKKIFNHFPMSSGGLSELLFSLIDTTNMHDATTGKIITFLSSLVMALVYQRDSEKSILSLQLLKDHLNLKKYIQLLDNDLPHHILNTIKEYIKTLPHNEGLLDNSQIDITTSEVHEKLMNHIRPVIDNMINCDLFTNDVNGILISDLLNKDKSIYLLNTDSSFEQKIILSLIRTSIVYRLGRSIENYGKEVVIQKNPSIYNIFIREAIGIKGMAVMPAQSRGSGIALTFSYSSFSQMKQLLQEEFESVFANTNTKVISHNEPDIENIIASLNLPNDTFLLNKDDSVTAHPANLDYVWIIKYDVISQISFKDDHLKYLNM